MDRLAPDRIDRLKSSVSPASLINVEGCHRHLMT